MLPRIHPLPLVATLVQRRMGHADVNRSSNAASAGLIAATGAEHAVAAGIVAAVASALTRI